MEFKLVDHGWIDSKAPNETFWKWHHAQIIYYQWWRLKRKTTNQILNLKLNRYQRQNIFYLASTWKHKNKILKYLPTLVCFSWCQGTMKGNFSQQKFSLSQLLRHSSLSLPLLWHICSCHSVSGKVCFHRSTMACPWTRAWCRLVANIALNHRGRSRVSTEPQ